MPDRNHGEGSETYAIAAIFANCDRVDETGDPNTLSISEIQSLGSRLLDLLDGAPEEENES